jgi:thioredoxin reductase
MDFDTPFDCVVVGGGAAGLSATLVLGRARRRTLLVDAGGQSNRPAPGIGGLLGQDGRPPDELYAQGRRELTAYPSVRVLDGEVVRASGSQDAFALELADGTGLTARRLVLATGMDYRHRELDGVDGRWGRSVFHCPFCHGWEHRDQALCALDADPATGVHRALLLRLWSDDVTLLADGPSALASADRERLADAGVTIDERPVAGVRGEGEALDAVVFADGAQRACGGLLIAVELHQRSPVAQQLGVNFAPAGPVAADAIAVDGRSATNVPGVFAAGDASAQMQSVANAIASGHLAAAMAVQSLLV